MDSQVRKIMTETTLRLAKAEGVSPEEINVFIHTKQRRDNEREQDYRPIKYGYTINGKVKKVEQKRGDDTVFVTRELHFRKEILNKMMDLVGAEAKATYFLVNKFNLFHEVYEERGLDVEKMYIILKPRDSKVEDFDIALIHNSEVLKRMTLEELFEI